MEETQSSIGSMVATAETAGESALRELERRIHELEAAMGGLRSVKAEAQAATGRKTISTEQVSLLAKGAADSVGNVDDALRSLSVEQRIAVKSGLMRAGLLR